MIKSEIEMRKSENSKNQNFSSAMQMLSTPPPFACHREAPKFSYDIVLHFYRFNFGPSSMIIIRPIIFQLFFIRNLKPHFVPIFSYPFFSFFVVFFYIYLTFNNHIRKMIILTIYYELYH